MKYLLDTNVISEPLRPKPSPRVLHMLQRHQDLIAIPSIVWHELRYGMERLPVSRRRTAIEQYLANVVLPTIPILQYDRAAAEWHASERARLVRRGRTPPFVDGQIAAIAFVNELTLVTFKDADFRGFHGVRVVTWV